MSFQSISTHYVLYYFTLQQILALFFNHTADCILLNGDNDLWQCALITQLRAYYNVLILIWLQSFLIIKLCAYYYTLIFTWSTSFDHKDEYVLQYVDIYMWTTHFNQCCSLLILISDSCNHINRCVFLQAAIYI